MLSANCSTDPYHAGNRTTILTGGSYSIDVTNGQFIDIEGFDEATGFECNGAVTSWMPTACPGGLKNRGVYFSQLSGQDTFRYMRIHGFMDGTTGAQGPGNQWLDSALVQNYHTGFNADDPFGTLGVRADGNSFQNVTVDTSGYADVLPRTLSSLSRDGSGNLNVAFTSGQIVKYIPGTHIVIQNAAPSDLNGTYTVSSVNFNQQSVNITGGSVAIQPAAGTTFYVATFNTSANPVFAAPAFVQVTGATPTFLNGYWLVSSVGTNQFTVNVSAASYPTWTTATISSGGTAATTLSLVASAAGSAETAAAPGQATYVRPASYGCDQGTTSVCNGDAWGGGYDTTGVWHFLNTSCAYNLQDCHDNLHGEIISDTVDTFYSQGNEGAPVKVGVADSVVVKNAILGATCAANLAPNPDFPPDYNQWLGMPCRANDALIVQERPWGYYVFTNDTFETTQNIVIDDISSGDSSHPLPMASFVMQNLLILGFLDSNNPTQSAAPAIYLAEYPGQGGPNAAWSWNNNMAFGTRNPPSGGANNHWNTIDPLVAQAVPTITTLAGEVNALTWNLNLTSSSPAIGAGVHNAYTPTLDYTGATRPNPPSVGAFEFSGTPACATPVPVPADGFTSTTPFSASWSTSTPGATIYFTRDGSTPTTGSPVFSSPYTVSVTETDKAMCTAVGYTPSSVATASYTVNPPPTTPQATVSGSVNVSGKVVIQ
jgi:hypothetical protein